MNDLHRPCERWAESISLAAAGCLAPDEERDVRRHIETCSDCGKRFRELTQLCGGLAEARLPADRGEAAIVGRIMSAVASDELERPTARTRMERIQPAVLTRCLDTWRRIMRSPVSRVAAAMIFVFAITGVALWFHGGGATPTFADFLEPIIEAKNARYKITTVMKGPPAGTAVSRVMELDGSRSRTEMEVEVEVGMPNKHKSKMVQIWDGRQAKSLHLEPAEKRARIYSYAKLPKDKQPSGSPVAGYRAILLNAREIPDLKRESLGEKEIDGRRVVGFHVSVPGMDMSVWGDPKTGLPVRIEATGAMIPNTKLTMSDFEFNVEMDESLFSVEPPAGYEVVEIENSTRDGSSPEEKDLIEMFRCYTEWCGGLFPDSLDHWSIDLVVRVVDQVVGRENGYSTEEPDKSKAERARERVQKRAQEWSDAQSKLQGGLQFVLRLPKEADWHYAGRGVLLGAADTPVFWYHPKDAKAYRVVYGDLSIRDADTPPSVPVVEPGLPEQDLIEMFRKYSELSGGPLPRSLDTMSLSFGLTITSRPPEKSNDPSAQQAQRRRAAEAQIRLQRGLKFASLLPKEADSHYAGKGVLLGAADVPIFWYRPKDSKEYRVIYADLSVRDAQTPPSVPNVLPEQDLIATLRCYSEVSGGPFPDSMKGESLLQIVMAKKCSFESLEQMRNPTANQTQEIMRYHMQFQPGLDFAASLPPEADAHYAGKGVSLGSADTPIFWYRPKDAKKYRVIYADLSVREADAPPVVPNAQPVPVPPSLKK